MTTKHHTFRDIVFSLYMCIFLFVFLLLLLLQGFLLFFFFVCLFVCLFGGVNWGIIKAWHFTQIICQKSIRKIPSKRSRKIKKAVACVTHMSNLT